MKTFVLDTNTIVHSPDCLYNFNGDNNIVVPMAALDGLDLLKNRDDLTGFGASEALRIIDEARIMGVVRDGSISVHDLYKHMAEIYKKENMPIASPPEHSNGRFRIVSDPVMDRLPNSIPLNTKVHDDRMIITALWLKKADENVILITRDPELRVRAEMSGVAAQDYTRDYVDLASVYTGYRMIRYEGPETMDQIIKGEHKDLKDPVPNEFAVIKVADNNYKVAQYKNNQWVWLPDKPRSIFDQKPKPIGPNMNIEQTLLFHLLNDPTIIYVCVTGAPGTGKSFITLAKGLEDSVENEKPLIIMRPLASASEEEIGFLPGTYEEKTQYWFSPVTDNLHQLIKIKNDKVGEEGKDFTVRELYADGYVSNETLIHLKGRTFINNTLLLDEGQDTTAFLMRLLATRVGVGTRLFITGDLTQASQKYRLSPYSNGLSFLISRMRGSQHFAHLNLSSVIRSDAAKEADERLKL